MKIDRYRLQTGVMESGKAHKYIARDADMTTQTLHKIMREGRCTHRQRNSIAKSIGVDPLDLTLWEE